MMWEQKEMYTHKKIFLILAIGVLFLSCGYFFFLMFSDSFFLEFEQVRIGEKEYVLERADTNEKRAKGLGGRETLCSSCAMLFIFDRPAQYTFWMKEMRFSIDIIWLLGDEIVHIEHRVSENNQNLYTPERESNRVIELNAGEAEALHSGERVKFLR